MFILTISAQAQKVYKFDKFYNYQHNSLLVSPYAVNNDEDTSLGSGVAKCKMTIYSDKIVIKNKKVKQTFIYESWIVEPYVKQGWLAVSE